MLTAIQRDERKRARSNGRARCPACGADVVAAPVKFQRHTYRWAHIEPCPGPGDGWFVRVARFARLSLAGDQGHPFVGLIHDVHGASATVVDARHADVETGLSYPGADPPSFLLVPAWGWLAEALRLAVAEPRPLLVALPDRTLFWAADLRPEVRRLGGYLAGVLCASFAGRRVGLAHALNPADAPLHPLDQYSHQRRSDT